MRRVSKSQNITAKIRKVNFAKNRKVLKNSIISLRTFAKPLRIFAVK